MLSTCRSFSARCHVGQRGVPAVDAVQVLGVGIAIHYQAHSGSHASSSHASSSAARSSSTRGAAFVCRICCGMPPTLSEVCDTLEGILGGPPAQSEDVPLLFWPTHDPMKSQDLQRPQSLPELPVELARMPVPSIIFALDPPAAPNSAVLFLHRPFHLPILPPELRPQPRNPKRRKPKQGPPGTADSSERQQGQASADTSPEAAAEAAVQAYAGVRAVLASHTRLDDRLGVGPNAALAARLGLEAVGAPLRYKERDIGAIYRLRQPCSFAALVARVEAEFGEVELSEDCGGSCNTAIDGGGDAGDGGGGNAGGGDDASGGAGGDAPQQWGGAPGASTSCSDGREAVQGTATATGHAVTAPSSSDRAIELIAMMGAFNEQLVPQAHALGAQVYFSGCARPSGVKAARQLGLGVVCVGQAGSEGWGLRYLAERLGSAHPGLSVTLLQGR